MSGPEYFPFYPDTFAGDGLVEAMTTEEVGAYILLLCKAWREEPAGSIPNDDRLLARWSRLSFTKFKRSREKILAPFLVGDDGRLHQKRMVLEYDRVMSRSSKARQSAELRWKNAERAKSGRNANASETNDAEAMRTHMRTHSEGNAIKREREKEREEKAPPTSSELFPSVTDDPSMARASRSAPPTPDALLAEWNSNRGDLPKANAMTADRKPHARARLKETPDLSRWTSAIQRMASSPFCRGENDRGWIADIDFLLKPNTLTKIEEGKYDNRKSGNGKDHAAAGGPPPGFYVGQDGGWHAYRKDP